MMSAGPHHQSCFLSIHLSLTYLPSFNNRRPLLGFHSRGSAQSCLSLLALGLDPSRLFLSRTAIQRPKRRIPLRMRPTYTGRGDQRHHRGAKTRPKGTEAPEGLERQTARRDRQHEGHGIHGSLDGSILGLGGGEGPSAPRSRRPLGIQGDGCGWRREDATRGSDMVRPVQGTSEHMDPQEPDQ